MLELKQNPDSESKVQGVRSQTSDKTECKQGTEDSRQCSNSWFCICQS